MKVGEKYIIEISDVVKGNLAKIKGFNTLVFDENGLNKLEKIGDDVQIFTPHEINDIKKISNELGYSEGYDDGFNDGVKHQASYIPPKEEEEEELREPQIGDVYRNKTSGAHIIVTYDDMGMYTVLFSDGDNNYYNAEELNKYYEFIGNRVDLLEVIKTALN